MCDEFESVDDNTLDDIDLNLDDIDDIDNDYADDFFDLSNDEDDDLYSALESFDDNSLTSEDLLLGSIDVSTDSTSEETEVNYTMQEDESVYNEWASDVSEDESCDISEPVESSLSDVAEDESVYDEWASDVLNFESSDISESVESSLSDKTEDESVYDEWASDVLEFESSNISEPVESSLSDEIEDESEYDEWASGVSEDESDDFSNTDESSLSNEVANDILEENINDSYSVVPQSTEDTEILLEQIENEPENTETIENNLNLSLDGSSEIPTDADDAESTETCLNDNLDNIFRSIDDSEGADNIENSGNDGELDVNPEILAETEVELSGESDRESNLGYEAQANSDNVLTNIKDTSFSENENEYDINGFVNDEHENEGTKVFPSIDPIQAWISANTALEKNLEAMRDDLRDKGMRDGSEMERIINAERIKAQNEIGRTIDGDLSYSDLRTEIDNELPFDNNSNLDVLNTTNNDQQDHFENISDTADEGESDYYNEILESLTEDDLASIREGLESYDFQEVDYLENSERLDESLAQFLPERWKELSLEEQKESINDLAQYIIDITKLEHPPKIEYYNNPQEGDYGGFSEKDNTLYINEHMLYQNNEAADTIAHELWHAFQHQRAKNPRTKLDVMYAENFDDYTRPKDDMVGYQSQLVESEARAFAQQIKERLSLL